MANRQTSINLNVSSSTDGFALSGGSTKRRLTVSKGDITLDGGSGNSYQFPPSSDTLVGIASTQTLTNKQITGSFTGSGKILYSETASFAFAGVEGGGVTDHGALTGLGDDDHTQYVLATGARSISGPISMSGWISSTDMVMAAATKIKSVLEPVYNYLELSDNGQDWELGARGKIRILADTNLSGPDFITFYNPGTTPVLTIGPSSITSSLSMAAVDFTASGAGLLCEDDSAVIATQKDLYIQLDSDNNGTAEGIFIYKNSGIPNTGTFVMAFNGNVHGRGTDIYLVSGSAPTITVGASSQLVHWCGSASASMASVVWGSGSTPPSNVPTGTIYFQL